MQPDSMDARYAALAIANLSASTEHRELLGGCGAMPLLVGLMRANIGPTVRARAHACMAACMHAWLHFTVKWSIEHWPAAVFGPKFGDCTACYRYP